MTTASADPDHAAVDLLWVPLGAGDGTHLVRWSGRAFEALAARRCRRPRVPLFHSALVVHVGAVRTTIEMTPAWGSGDSDRGVVSRGPVGLRCLGRSPAFRYEVRRWPGGTITDEAEAVGGPYRVSTDADTAQHLLSLVPLFPPATWGRDELDAGEMWNSNSLTAWLLAASGHDTQRLRPPRGGRAPGWSAGLVVAQRQTTPGVRPYPSRSATRDAAPMSTKPARKFSLVNDVANRLAIPFLRSSAGTRLGRRLAVVDYVGRRSGKPHQLVAHYVRDGAIVRIQVGMADRKTWWRNFQEPWPVHLRLEGVEHHASGHVLRSEAGLTIEANLCYREES
jgi:hypothetical protein